MSVVIEGLAELEDAVAGWPDEIARRTTTQILHEVTGMQHAMASRAASYGRLASSMARQVRIVALSDGYSMALTGTLAAGAEYGGRKRPKKTYATRSRWRRTVYVVKRRTTQQFLPHLGSRGYFFWETARHDLKGINGRIRLIIEGVANGTG